MPWQRFKAIRHDSAVLVSFIQLSNAFVGAGRQDIGKGQMPKTPENESLLQKVSDLSDALYNYRYMG